MCLGTLLKDCARYCEGKGHSDGYQSRNRSGCTYSSRGSSQMGCAGERYASGAQLAPEGLSAAGFAGPLLTDVSAKMFCL